MHQALVIVSDLDLIQQNLPQLVKIDLSPPSIRCTDHNHVHMNCLLQRLPFKTRACAIELLFIIWRRGSAKHLLGLQ